VTRALLVFHALFAGLCVALVALMPAAQFGATVLGLAIAYNLLLPAYALLRGHKDWLARWWFLLPVSLLQVLPDWVLVEVTQTLYFPDHGIARIGGAVPLYFMGLWMMLLFPVTQLADAAGTWRYPLVLALGGLAFAAAEFAAAPLQLWVPRGVDTVAGMAVYPIPAEMLLCLLALWLYRLTRHSPWTTRLLAGLSLPITYTGALMLALLFME
jgi:hypothetical protein